MDTHSVLLSFSILHIAHTTFIFTFLTRYLYTLNVLSLISHSHSQSKQQTQEQARPNRSPALQGLQKLKNQHPVPSRQLITTRRTLLQQAQAADNKKWNTGTDRLAAAMEAEREESSTTVTATGTATSTDTTTTTGTTTAAANAALKKMSAAGTTATTTATTSFTSATPTSTTAAFYHGGDAEDDSDSPSAPVPTMESLYGSDYHNYSQVGTKLSLFL
jgi:hypothetical protein